MSVAFPRVTYGPFRFRIKQGDTQPPITHTTVDDEGNRVSLMGAISTSFIYRRKDAAPVTAVSQPALIVNADAGQLIYYWDQTDTAIVGEYYAEWRIVFPNSQIRTFPQRGYQLFVVEPDLG